MKIKEIDALQVFDSRGMPTIEAIITLDNGVQASAIVPSGASTGTYEAWELRDGDPTHFMGKSVQKAIRNIKETISKHLLGENIMDQSRIDQRMIDLDGTPHKANLGANAILAVSLACARAAAKALHLPLYHYLSEGKGSQIPLPEIQIIGGGKHSSGRIDVQDFMVVCPNATTLSQCYEMTFNIYQQTGQLLQKANKLAGLADEGGYWPQFDHHEEVFTIILQAIEQAGYRPGEDVFLSLDVAASELYGEDHRYHLSLEETSFSAQEFSDYLSEWCERYPILLIEDPFHEDDWNSWQKFTRQMGSRLKIIGDDLFATNIVRIKKGFSQGAGNSVLIKLNQIGTLTETLQCIDLVKKNGWLPVVSARSGETEDPFIAHLAVATNAGMLKVGSFATTSRMVKWNELLRIEHSLAGRAQFLGLPG